MYKIEEKLVNYKINPFTEFGYDCPVVSAGSINDFNTMTIAWGQMGTLWSKPVCTVFIKPIRYTYKFMEENDYFTISFFDKEYLKDINYIGTHSGKDEDKIAKTSLHPIEVENGVTFKEAKVTIVCRKIYHDDLKLEYMENDVIHHYYESELPHRVYVGEVVKIID